MIVAIVGSRDFPTLSMVGSKVLWLRETRPGVKVISGGARGVDSVVRQRCEILNVEFEEFPADWSLGKQAGFIRNQRMVEMADLVIAFWDGESKGTKHTIDLALKMRKQLEVYFP